MNEGRTGGCTRWIGFRAAMLCGTAAIAILACCLAGCARVKLLKTDLGREESVERNDRVYVDGIDSGYVKRVTGRDANREALLAITDTRVARERVRPGIAREPGSGRVRLTSARIDKSAAPVPDGYLVPAVSAFDSAASVFAKRETLWALAATVLFLLLFVFLMRRVMGVVLLALALSVAVFTAAIVSPAVRPFVDRLYAMLPEPPAAMLDSEGRQIDDAGDGGMFASVGRQVTQIVRHRPDPDVAAFGIATIASFLLYAALLSRAKRWVRD